MSKPRPVILKIALPLVLPLLFAAFGIYIFIVSFGYQFETRAFAHATGTVLAILSVSVIVRDLVRGMKQTEVEGPPGEDARRIPPLFFALAWCVAFFILVLLVGFDIATPLWVFSLLLWNRASWLATVLIPIVLWALVKPAIEVGLDTILFQGILFGDHLPRFW